MQDLILFLKYFSRLKKDVILHLVECLLLKKIVMNEAFVVVRAEQ